MKLATTVPVVLTKPAAGYEAGTVLTATRTGFPHDYGAHMTYFVPHADRPTVDVALAPLTFQRV